MYKLRKNGLKILKILHIIAACCWVGGGVSMLTLNLNNSAAISEGMLYGINTASHLIDTWVVIISGALGCLITGLLYGIFTTWGFFKHRWLIGKWVLTAFAIISGTLFLGPGEASMLELSRELGTIALYSDAYLAVKANHLHWSLVQITLYFLMIILSVIKPWGKRKSTKKNPTGKIMDAPTNG